MKVSTRSVADFDPRNQNIGRVVPKGKAHLLCTEVKKATTKNDDEYVILKLQVAAHEDDSAVGMFINQRFYPYGGGIPYCVNFCMAAGLMSADDYLRQVQVDPDSVEIPIDETQGRHICATIKHKTFNDETSAELNNFKPFVSPFSPEAAEYPLSSELLQAGGPQQAGVTVEEVPF